MVSDHNNRDEPSDESPASPADDEASGLVARLRAIVESLAEIEVEEGGHRRASGQIGRGGARIDYGYDVSIGLGVGNRPASRGGQPSADRARFGEPTPVPGDAGEAIHIETRVGPDDELVVIADLPGVTDEDTIDIALDADGPALELRADEEVIDRIPLDQSDVTVTDVRLNNQILEIRLARPAGSNGGDST